MLNELDILDELDISYRANNSAASSMPEVKLDLRRPALHSGFLPKRNTYIY